MKIKTNKPIVRIKPKWELKIYRSGELVYWDKRYRDLYLWRGQMIFAYLLSQGAVGSSTGIFRMIVSENEDIPNMGDDSGNPEANEFNPLIGTPVNALFDFEPTIKPNSYYQTYATLKIYGTVISDGSKTVRKMGIIDSKAIPNRGIIVADSVVPVGVILNDELYIQYTIQFG